jgi:ferredoxin--NADP+ reductase
MPGSLPATAFVGWYNGHPDQTDLEVDLLSAQRAVVIGNGNVALDVARMLVLANEELAVTDCADHALDVLAHSRVSEVIVVGRRGPAQAAFTNPELRELGELSEADVIVDADGFEQALSPPDPALEGNAIARNNVEILREYSQREPQGKPRRIELRFLRSPIALLAGENGRLGAVELARNELVADESGALRARATSEHETIETGLLFRAIGYRGIALPGVPFDERRGLIPNEEGRVTDPATGAPVAGEYVVGWIKRGPTGVIGTNKKDAQQTVDALLADLGPSANGSRRHEPDNPDAQAVERMLRERQPELVPYVGWLEIDRHERSRGEESGRPRVKITRVEEMLRVAAAQEGEPSS